MTRDALGVTEDVPLGDPGILVGRHVPRLRARWRLGLVPHGFHRQEPGLQEFSARTGQDVTVIDVRARPGPVIRHIASCSAIVTTSLHGLIVADALGIPAAWTRRQPDLWGGDFKFRDYEAVMTPGRSREIVVAPDTTLADVLAGTDQAEDDARAESVLRLESTIPRLPVSRDRPWRAFAHKGR
nr:polysaccharide pyruvyl transferase family protein [Janibacter cremeus]